MGCFFYFRCGILTCSIPQAKSGNLLTFVRQHYRHKILLQYVLQRLIATCTTPTHFACSVSPLYRHGRRWFQTVVSFSIEKLIVEQCTRTYTAQQPSTAYPPTHKCVNSRAPSQAEAKIEDPAVRTAVVPLAYSAAVRAAAPTAAA